MSKDPPIGRWGFVVENAFGEGKTQHGTREVRCNGPDHKGDRWFDAHLHRCPTCEFPRPAFNKWLRTAQLNRHLGEYAHTANRQPKYTPNITSDVTA